MNGNAILMASALALALGSGSALAASDASGAKPIHHARQSTALPSPLPPPAEIAMVEGAAFTPAQAAAAAERYVGGKAVAFGARQESGAPRYAVDVLVGERVARVYVDPRLGTADGTTWLGPVDRVFAGFDQKSMEALLARRSLPDAIAEAERNSGKRVIAAAPFDEHGNRAFRAMIHSGGRLLPTVVG